MSKSDQIDQLKKERSQQLYGLHKPVIDKMIESLPDDTDRLFSFAESYLDAMQNLVNTYSIIAGSIKDEYMMFHVEQMHDLIYMISLLHDKHKMKSFELQRYTQTIHKRLKEVQEE